MSDSFADKISEWIDRSQGRIRADRVHEKLRALGYRPRSAPPGGWWRRSRRSGAETTTGLTGHGPPTGAVAAVGLRRWAGDRGAQGGAVLRLAGVVALSSDHPLADRTLPSVIAALDRCFRLLGGAPTYALSDNEKTVTERHVARLAVRNSQIVSASVYYGVSIRTCEPADPETKGGSEATVRITKTDLVRPRPTAGGLRRLGRAGGRLQGGHGALHHPTSSPAAHQ